MGFEFAHLLYVFWISTALFFGLTLKTFPFGRVSKENLVLESSPLDVNSSFEGKERPDFHVKFYEKVILNILPRRLYSSSNTNASNSYQYRLHLS